LAVDSKIQRDPVCGMPINSEKSKFQACSIFGGNTYCFCSEECKNIFIENPRIAYVSMEICIVNDIPTYSGGLGALAGDTIRSSADLKIPLVAVTLASRKGYLKQKITSEGEQLEYPEEWHPSSFLKKVPETVIIRIGNRDVQVQAWLFEYQSITGGVVPILFLDTDMEGNTHEDRKITHHLYGGDERYRLKQEMVLGIGGKKLFKKLFLNVKKYHMNEGHSSLLTLELLKEHNMDPNKVRSLCVFTTHTPVEAAFDKFSYNIVQELLGEEFPLKTLKQYGGEDHLNMVFLASNLSKYINGVSTAHVVYSMKLFPRHHVRVVNNGIHSYTWTCNSFKKIYDKYIPGWANEPVLLARASQISNEEIWTAHVDAKKKLLDFIENYNGLKLDEETLTLGFARRATSYKRATLIFSDLERLKEVNRKGRFQLVFAGKAHPKDLGGKKLIKNIYAYKNLLKNAIKIVYLENYNMDIAAKLTSGVDVWLNTPLPPLEASGTSGMKAAHNGVINFSVLDGWWIDGCIEGVTGWAIGPHPNQSMAEKRRRTQELDDLYNKMDYLIIPKYYNYKDEWIKMMKTSIEKIAYYFNSNCMMMRYITEAYFI